MSQIAFIETDTPADQTLRYYIDDSIPAKQDYFIMEQVRGGLIVRKPLDYERINELILFLRVKSSATKEEAWQVLEVLVADVDEPPQFHQPEYEKVINLTADAKHDDNTTLLTVQADDPEGRAVTYSYPCKGVNKHLKNITVTATSGEIVVAPGYILKAKNATYKFCVQANDTSLQGYGMVGVVLHVRDLQHTGNGLTKTGGKETTETNIVTIVLLVVSALVMIL